ncbi:unnamed protein product [Rhizoctonia solani]|uniref:Heme haloperoxidase family profile domain-containing protein n=1 Tax=Rhizoctonia solani TaxID=456999 RepID=A0A8H2W6V7_9AGAM|nr:unnamed protein product [Rhizoctonia solani]
MRPLAIVISLAVATSSLAFPTTGSTAQKETTGCPFAASSANSKRGSNVASLATFDPVKQKIDVSGKYAFQAPRPGDKRGPCPGLNALANHGYLPRNGVTNFIQAIGACNKVFGMGTEIGASLSTVAWVLTGNPLDMTWSMGGSPGGLVLPPLLSAPQGLSGAHNKFEGDGSPTRSDLYLNNGDASTMNLEYFKQLYDMKPEGDPNANFDYDTIVANRAKRFRTSVSENPHFFYGPITGLFLSPGAHGFIPRLMSNHSTDAPEGVLNHDTLKSFFGVTGNSANLTYRRGYERIPDNWYRRPTDYTLVHYSLDIVNAGLKHPEFLAAGGNTGKVNSFAGVNLGNITGGVYNSANLLEGNNLICFTFQVVLNVTPDILRGALVGEIFGNVLGLLSKTFTPILSGLGCPELIKYDASVFKAYPGAGAGL